jgi:hypothetical protein
MGEAGVVCWRFYGGIGAVPFGLVGVGVGLGDRTRGDVGRCVVGWEVASPGLDVVADQALERGIYEMLDGRLQSWGKLIFYAGGACACFCVEWCFCTVCRGEGCVLWEWGGEWGGMGLGTCWVIGVSVWVHTFCFRGRGAMLWSVLWVRSGSRPLAEVLARRGRVSWG